MTMPPLFSPEGEAALRVASQARALLVFDFDGTLAPIVDDPADAYTPPETARWLQALRAHHAIAVVSGRALADLGPRLRFAPTYLVGNHGAEGLDELAQPPDSVTIELATAVKARVAAAQAGLHAAGVTFEDKGRSWTLHYRHAPDAAHAQAEIAHVLEGLDPRLEAYPGKCCVNVVVAGSPHKGLAVEALVRKAAATRAVFIGDDVTDESVYRMQRPDWLTVHVGHAIHASEAMYCLDDQHAVVRVLRRLHELATRTAG